MDSVIVDTDVLSYLFKRDTRGESYRPHLHGRLGILSFMTIAELEFWARIRNWGPTRRAELSAFLEPYTIVQSDDRLCETWAEVRSQVMRDGRHIDTADCWIAATARLYDIPLLTHNANHFVHVDGLKIVSEAES